MLLRLPYRLQIPIGLTLGVVTTALIVTVVAAQISARTARMETLATVDSAIALLAAQARPLLAADDTWRVFALLRNTAALLPGADRRLARAAVLDADGKIVAGSDPSRLETGRQVLSELVPDPRRSKRRVALEKPDRSLTLIDPVSSEDGQVLGYSYVEVDAPVFAPDWAALAKPALLGALLAVGVLAPIGWLVGKRMARPVGRVADCISRIGTHGYRDIDGPAARRWRPGTQPDRQRSQAIAH